MQTQSFDLFVSLSGFGVGLIDCLPFFFWKDTQKQVSSERKWVGTWNRFWCSQKICFRVCVDTIWDFQKNEISKISKFPFFLFSKQRPKASPFSGDEWFPRNRIPTLQNFSDISNLIHFEIHFFYWNSHLALFFELIWKEKVIVNKHFWKIKIFKKNRIF